MTKTTMATSKKPAPSSAETTLRIKQLLKKLPEERADAARLDELRRLFAKLVSSGQLSFDTNTTTNDKDSPTAKWNAYLLKQHKVFVSQLCHCIQQGRKTAIRTLFGVIAASPQQDRINQQLVHVWIQSIPSNMDKTIQTMLQGEFVQPYRDVQCSVLVSIAKLAAQQYQQQEQQNEEEMETAAERLFQILLMIPIPKSLEEMEQDNYLFEPSLEQVNDEGESNDDDDESSVASNQSNDDDDDQDSSDDDSTSDNQDTHHEQTFRKRKRESTSPAKRLVAKQYNAHKRALSHAWLAVLKLPLPTCALKMALQFLPSNILPHVPNPLLFADFFMQAYKYTGGSVIAVLSLEGLFLLMTQYGLEYPLFYTSLYRLVQPSIFYVKYKTKFIELLHKCLSRNDLLPGHLVAAFVKRILRTALLAPPPGILVSLALVANLLRKYPECAALIHRETNNGATTITTMDISDPFDSETNDPTQTRALESSLWELSALSHHYYPAVVTLARSIGTETRTTPMHDFDEFLRLSYKSLFEQERKRSQKRRKVALTFVEPRGLWSSSTTDDVLHGMLELSPESNEEV